MIRRYRGKISGPLFDRIDLRVSVRALGSHELLDSRSGESSADVKARVSRARRVQERRFRRGRAKLNAFMTPNQITRYCSLSHDGEAMVKRAADRLRISARGFHRILKVARTVADLAGAAEIEPPHLQEAIVFRTSSGEAGR